MWSIRHATGEDHAAVDALWAMTGLHRMTVVEWSAFLEGRRSAILIAEDEGATIGTAVAAFDGWRSYIYHVAVHPTRRKDGIGRALMAEAERTLVEAGARNAYAMVSDTGGLALIEGSGFSAEGETVLAKRLARASKPA